jgi:hypothetical protein
MPKNTVHKSDAGRARRNARKAEIVAALKEVCGEMGSLPGVKPEQDLYIEVQKFLGAEVQRLRGQRQVKE